MYSICSTEYLIRLLMFFFFFFSKHFSDCEMCDATVSFNLWKGTRTYTREQIAVWRTHYYVYADMRCKGRVAILGDPIVFDIYLDRDRRVNFVLHHAPRGRIFSYHIRRRILLKLNIVRSSSLWWKEKTLDSCKNKMFGSCLKFDTSWYFVS